MKRTKPTKRSANPLPRHFPWYVPHDPATLPDTPELRRTLAALPVTSGNRLVLKRDN